ncbi:MAG TPA: hypothetical protein VIN75_06425, partial [Burkholderiaceae bacterium]
TYWRSDVRAASIFASVGLRVLFVQGRLGFLRRPWVAPAAFLAGMVLSTHHVPEPLKYSLATLGIALAVNSLEGAPALGRRFLGSRAIGWVGVVSYSLYIWQQPFYYSIDKYGALPMALAAVAVAVLSFYLVENPVRVRLNALRARRRARLAAAAG